MDPLAKSLNTSMAGTIDLEAAFFNRLEEVHHELFRLRKQVVTLNEEVVSLTRELHYVRKSTESCVEGINQRKSELKFKSRTLSQLWDFLRRFLADLAACIQNALREIE